MLSVSLPGQDFQDPLRLSQPAVRECAPSCQLLPAVRSVLLPATVHLSGVYNHHRNQLLGMSANMFVSGLS